MEDGTGFRKTLAPGAKEKESYPPPTHTHLPDVLTQDDEQRFADLEEQDELRATKRAG